jgi:two-component system, OmpR family, response regulator
MHVLVVERDPTLGSSMASAVRKLGHSVTLVSSAAVARAFLAQGWPDMVVLDLESSRPRGTNVIRRFCEHQRYVPVLAVIEPDGMEARVRALRMGADDCLGKPFALKEFRARVEALGRRLPSGHQSICQRGSLTMDLINHTAQVDGRLLELSKIETLLLEVLMRNSGRVVRTDAMLDALSQGRDHQVKPTALHVYIHRLRRKLIPSGAEIRLLRGRGYVLSGQPGVAAR